jgi:hypothetical protein
MALGSLSLACGEDPYVDPPIWDAAPRDGQVDARAPDAAPLPDRPISLEGPTVLIQAPSPLTVVSGKQIQVAALVTDADGVNVSSVAAVIAGGLTYPLNRSGASPDLYTGFVDLRSVPTGPMTIIVQAADLPGNVNSASVDVVRDTGPTFEFFSPGDGDRYSGSVNLSFRVSDPNGVRESSVIATIGTVLLSTVKRSQDQLNGSAPQWIEFAAEIVFDDPMFSPPLAGEQQISVVAENINHSVSSSGSVNFVVDDAGPAITIVTPTAGQIVGGIIDIEAEVSDPAGVMTTSVVAVLGNNALQYTVPLEPSGNAWRATFDTRQLPGSWVFPTISVRAADVLSNESSVGYLIALDNTRPILSLDPPENLRIIRRNSDSLDECSWEFDPVGDDVPNDLETVPQIFFVRARIEDRGNQALGLVQEMVSLVDPATVYLFVLDDTARPLVIDTDGDGFCDEINPELVPSTNPQLADEVLALNLVGIPPAGDADFTMDLGTLPAPCQIPGTENEVPEPLCPVVPATIAIGYTVTTDEPAIYTIPQQVDSDALFCTGHQFDSLAASIHEGWACLAVRAVDHVGNIGVSPPLRVCIDYTMNGQPDCNPAAAPDCTGRQDVVTKIITSTPCQFDTSRQVFRDREVLRYLD